LHEASVEEDRVESAARELWHEVEREMKAEWISYEAAWRLAEEHVARVYALRQRPSEGRAEARSLVPVP
jgi:hypothetical protein